MEALGGGKHLRLFLFLIDKGEPLFNNSMRKQKEELEAGPLYSSFC